MPAGPNDLTVLETAYAWLGASPGSDDVVIQRLITSFSTRIQKWMGYNLAQTSYTKTFNGRGTKQFYVPDLPLVSVQSVTIDGVSIPVGQFSGGAQQAGFYNDSVSVFARGYLFTKGFQNVVLSYTSGFSPIPGDVEQACLDWMKIAYFRKAAGVGPDVIQIKAGDTQMNWGSASAAVTDPDKIPIPTAIYVALADYQRKAQVSGY